MTAWLQLGAVPKPYPGPLSPAGDELERLDPALVVELQGRAVVCLHLDEVGE